MYDNVRNINKIKSNNNKFPLPKLKYVNFNNQTQIKNKTPNNQPPINYYINYNSENYKNIQQDIYKPKEQKEENNLNYKTNIKIKTNEQKNINNNRNNSGKYKLNKSSNSTQDNLNYLLKEFGLSKYIEKLKELGYNNNNYLKIGTLSRKNFNNLINLMNILPIHTPKIEKFYEYLKKLNMSSYYNHNVNSNNITINKKTKLNYNSIYGLNKGNKPNQSYNYNHYSNYDNYNNKEILNNSNSQKNKKSQSPRNRPNSSNINNLRKTKIKMRNAYSGNKLKKNTDNNLRINSPFKINGTEDENNKNNNTNQPLIKEYLTENRKYIINNILNNNNYMDIYNKYNENNNIDIINPRKNDQDILYNYYNNYNKNRQKELEEKINKNMEKMLNYYMVQLNDKLDKSYETVEDSTLSCIVSSQINESQINKNKNNENKIIPNYKLPNMNNFNSLNNKKKDKNNENNNNYKNLDNINNIKLRCKYEENKNISDINKEKVYENEKIIEKNNKDNKEVKQNNIEEKEITNYNINSTKKVKNSKLEEKKIKEEQEYIKKEIIKLKEENLKKANKLISDPGTSTKSKDSKEPEFLEEEVLKEKSQTQTSNINQNLTDRENNEKKETNKINPRDLLLDDSNYISDKNSLEQNIFENLRLNKSMDEDNINKDTLKFDIEYMCRCLSLSLMKLIEQGKEKQHLMELYETNENKNLEFIFFNTEYNKNIHMIKDFFNTINENNEKLGDSNMISILEKFSLENNDIDNDNIDMMKHIKKSGDEKIVQKGNIQEETFKFRNGLADIGNEFKFMGDFFSYGIKRAKNYQSLSENTQKILCKDLSYIKEIDSELNKTGSIINSNIGNSNSGVNVSKINSNINKNGNNSEYNFSKEDSKSNHDNKKKISDEDEKDEEDYDDFNYEDEFLNENNSLDDKNEEKEKKNNKENILKKGDDKDNKEDKEDINNNKEKDKDDDKDKNNNNNLLNKDEIKGEIKNEEIKQELNKIENEGNIKTKEAGINSDLNDKKILLKDNFKIEKNIKNEESSNDIETNYIIDVDNINKFKEYLLKKFEVFDEDFLYYSMNIPLKRYMAPPDPQSIFDFCANIMILSKMEKEVIIISLIYIERLIFNTGFIINSRNWRKIIFIALIIASKIWDDDSFENIHYSQMFNNLRIGEINLLERTFLELINYKIFIKFSEYIKYYFAIKNLSLKYNFNGQKIVHVSVKKMMKLQEYAYQIQKRMRKKNLLNNSAHF